MRPQRRTTFAAPLVMVVGCSGAAVVPPPPTPLRPEPIVAADAAMPDATCIDGKIDTTGQDIDWRLEMKLEWRTAIGRVVEVERSPNQLRVTVELLAGDNVEPMWGARYLDGTQPVGSTFSIVEVKGNRFIIVTDASCQLPSMRVMAKRPECCLNPPRPNRP